MLTCCVVLNNALTRLSGTPIPTSSTLCAERAAREARDEHVNVRCCVILCIQSNASRTSKGGAILVVNVAEGISGQNLNSRKHGNNIGTTAKHLHNHVCQMLATLAIQAYDIKLLVTCHSRQHIRAYCLG